MSKRISIILPVYNEEETIANTAKTIIELMEGEEVSKSLAANNINDDILNYENQEAYPFNYEIIFVNDGSRDNSWQVISDIAQKHDNVLGLALSRNFGKEQAIYAGLKESSGDAVIIMDGDLQHPPAVIPKMIKIWQEKQCHVVNAVKSGRANEEFSSTWMVEKFYKIYKSFTGIAIKGASDFKLLDRIVVDEYVKLNEKDLFFRGLVPWLGFNQDYIEFDIDKRKTGCSKWSPLSRYLLAINAITSFSSLPLQFVTLMGVIFFIISVILGLQTLYVWLFGDALEGFTTLILVILFTGSVLMISLGIIGQYLAKIYSEIKQRPVYILQDKVGFKDD